MSDIGLMFKYVFIYADEDGETHFRDMEMPLIDIDYAPPAPLIPTSENHPATGMVVIGFKPGWEGDFHCAPRNQWMTVVSGSLEIGVSDGEKRIFGPGTVTYQEEANSKGHSTRTVGDENCILTVTAVN